MLVIEGQTFADVVNRVVDEFRKGAESREIKRIGLDAKTLSLSPVVYSFNAKYPIIRGALRQSWLWTYNELLSEWYGINPQLNHYYFPDYSKYVDIEVKVGDVVKESYTYGERWQVKHQIMNIIERLRRNIHTRQALMVIYTPWDTSVKEFNIPCTILHQFRVRQMDDQMLMDTFVYMRSNDLLRGFLYDPVLASFLNQVITAGVNYRNNLNVVPGKIYFFIADLHVYESDLPTLNSFSFVNPDEFIIDGEFPDIVYDLELLRAFEFMLRNKISFNHEQILKQFKTNFACRWATKYLKYWFRGEVNAGK